MGDPAVIRIFDTTLRDGEQSPGATMTTEEKIQVAEQLVRLNVDIIEAGFPAASPGDLEAVQQIARRTRGVAIAGLARADISDIDAVWEAIRDADQPVIHVVLATSGIHLTHKLKKRFKKYRLWLPTHTASAPLSNFQPKMLPAASGTTSVVFLKRLLKRAQQPLTCLIPLVTQCRTSTKRYSAICVTTSQV